MYPTLNRPYSKGYIKLKSIDPFAHPIIQPNYLADSRDMEALREGEEMVPSRTQFEEHLNGYILRWENLIFFIFILNCHIAYVRARTWQCGLI